MKHSKSFNDVIARREMLRRCLRGGGLAAVGGLAAWLAARSLRAGCLRANPCGDCPWFSGCDLPKAREAKSPSNPRSGHG